MTVVEFAIVAPVLCITLMGFLDLGYRSWVNSMVQGALHDAVRMATIGDKTGDQIDTHVKTSLADITKGATIKITKSSYEDFSQVKKPEAITQDLAPVGQYNAGDCFDDYNRNGQWDADRGKAGLGTADDILNYEVQVSFPGITPMRGLLGWPATETVTGSTVLRNQPYAARSTGQSIVCS